MYITHPEEADRVPQCGAFSGPGWEELHRQWENAR
jgi:hypothetical protein